MKIRINESYIEAETDGGSLMSFVSRNSLGRGPGAFIFNAHKMIQMGWRCHTNESNANEIEDCHESAITYHPVSIKTTYTRPTIKFYLKAEEEKK